MPKGDAIKVLGRAFRARVASHVALLPAAHAHTPPTLLSSSFLSRSRALLRRSHVTPSFPPTSLLLPRETLLPSGPTLKSTSPRFTPCRWDPRTGNYGPMEGTTSGLSLARCSVLHTQADGRCHQGSI